MWAIDISELAVATSDARSNRECFAQRWATIASAAALELGGRSEGGAQWATSTTNIHAFFVGPAKKK